MKKIYFLTIFLAVALVCNAQKTVAKVAASNAKQVELRLNLPKGKIFEQNMDMKMTMKMNMMGMQIDTDVPVFFKISYKVVDIQNENFVLECTYQAMKMSMDILGQKINYDSSDKKQDLDKNPFAKIMSSMIGKSFVMTLDKFQNVVAIEGLDKLIASIFEKGEFSDAQKEQMESMVKEMLSEEKFKENFSSSNIVFPKEPVNEEFSWDTETAQDLQGMRMQVKNQFKITKITDKNVEIASVSYYSMDFDVKEGDQNVNVKMQDAKATGTYMIDLQTGWTISSTFNADMKMVMTTSGIEVPLQIIMEMVVK